MSIFRYLFESGAVFITAMLASHVAAYHLHAIWVLLIWALPLLISAIAASRAWKMPRLFRLVNAIWHPWGSTDPKSELGVYMGSVVFSAAVLLEVVIYYAWAFWANT
ncbi:hypothetical protein [Gallaecimonas mangrovi]|uniref:hypothetical protein n=1 Tax=Gallaecimonas mangrovi TaxID=2291597 RepID=UPI000E2054B6|nr:hypothetical protein [Gallaecimonas mangrovi]